MKLKCFKNKKGQSLVETALVLPIIILLLTGIVDFGLLFNNYLVVSNASREGARSAITGSTNEQIRAVVNTVAASLDPDKLDVTISPDLLVGRSTGVAVVVTVKYDYSMVTPIIAALVPGPFQLKTSTTMRCE